MKNTIIALFLMLAFGANAHEFNMDFVNPTTKGSKFRVTLKMSAQNKAFYLGSNNFRFAYNPTELSNPQIVEEQFTADFAKTNLTGSNPNTGIVSVNSVYKGENNNRSIAITKQGSELVTLEFDVVNPSVRPTLTWKLTGKGPKTVALNDDIVSKAPLAKTKKTSTSLRISPNPTTDIISIGFEATQSGKVTVSLLDIVGREIKSQNENVFLGINLFNMNLSNVPSGSYFVNIQSETGKTVQKVIKQ